MVSPLKCPTYVPEGRSASLSTRAEVVSPPGASKEDGTGPRAGLRGHTRPSWLGPSGPEPVSAPCPREQLPTRILSPTSVLQGWAQQVLGQQPGRFPTMY